MVDNVNPSTLELIKLQEQEKEAKLKEKLENTISSLNRAIRQATIQAEKSEQEQEKIIKSIGSLRKEKMLGECRRDTLTNQLNALKNELKELRAKSDEEIAKVWETRSSFCEEIHSTSDACDVKTLLMKPSCAEPVFRSIQKKFQMPTGPENESRLQAAIERRIKALAERDRLTMEPENGEEFLRMKNALRYSLNKIAELNKESIMSVRQDKPPKMNKNLLNFRNFIKPKRFNRPFSTEIKENEPIKFSTSNAAKRSLPSVFRNKAADTMPWYQPYSVIGSVAVFLIYFCVLREENDVDKEFTKTLYERIKGLEKEQLLQSYKFNKENGLSVADIERRLKEIETEEAKLAA